MIKFGGLHGVCKFLGFQIMYMTCMNFFWGFSIRNIVMLSLVNAWFVSICVSVNRDNGLSH